MSAVRLPEAIADAVLDDLRGRSGFDHWWDALDEELRDEVRDAAAVAVTQVLTRVRVSP